MKLDSDGWPARIDYWLLNKELRPMNRHGVRNTYFVPVRIWL